MSPISPIDERHKYLEEARERAEVSDFVLYQGKYQAFPVINIPIELPLYRVENGRVAVLKTDYIETHNTSQDYFDNAQESPEIQSILKEMLIELAQNPEANIFNELSVATIQTNRLLLTGDGVVLDGNRRLASMRSLIDKDPETYSGFSKIEAVILPLDASKADLEMVEAMRQMAPDLKLAYGWIDRRIKLRQHRDSLKLPVEMICQAYRLKSEDQLHSEIEELELAETYLGDYLNQPLHYKSIGEAEELFSGLQKQLVQMPDKMQYNTWKLIGFAMIKEARNNDVEAYNQFPFTPSRPPYAPVPVLELYGGENDLWPYTAVLGTGEFLKSADYPILSDHLANAHASATIAADIIRQFNQIFTERDERPHPIATINRLRQVNKMLNLLELSNFTESQRSELFGQLAETSYQFRYLTKREDDDLEQPIVITGFPYSLKRLLRRVIRVISKVKK